MRPFETLSSGRLVHLVMFAEGWVILREEEMAGWSKNKLPLKGQHRESFCIRLLVILSSTSWGEEGFHILLAVSSSRCLTGLSVVVTLN